MPIELWPPLRVIRSHFAPRPGDEAAAAAAAPDTGARRQAIDADLQLPLAELARRRQAVQARAFHARWEPGRLISVLHEGRLLGVLLDRPLEQGGLWQGWLAASEADWASAFDVLLEPGDEPFEPLFGLVQAWNAVTVAPAPQWVARVQGELSATRLAAIRAVHDEFSRGAPPAIEPEPGRIALRTVAGAFTVLSGTPLGPEDERADYQRIYREAAAQLSAASRRLAAAVAAPPPVALAQPVPPAARPGPAAGQEDSPWARARRWFAADAWVRPAFALLALVVVVQNTGLMNLGSGTEERESEVRFRDVASEPAGPSADLAVIWKPGVTVDDSARLLRSLDAEVVAGPDVRGAWFLRVPDLSQGSTALSASPLVASVAPP